MNNYFGGKKILFIAPAFFDYEMEIKKRLESLGAAVDYFDDRPSKRAWSKIAIRVMPRLQTREVRAYFTDLLRRATADYDFVFIIKLECMPLDVLEELRVRNPDAKFIYYSWDSVKNNRNIRDCVQVFDSAFTFDEEDAKIIGAMKFRPLFFLNEYRDLPGDVRNYDISFIGSAHSDRYRLTKKIRESQALHGLRMFFFLYLSSKWVGTLRRIFMPAFWGSKINEFSFSSLSKEEVLGIISESGAILDFQHPNQTGLTMRTIEMLGARRKLITTNSNVKSYDFYRPENIAVIDRDAPEIDPIFFATQYVRLPDDLYEKYSIDGWLAEIFSIQRESMSQ